MKKENPNSVIIDCINRIQNLCEKLDEIIDKNNKNHKGNSPTKEEKCKKEKLP